MPFDFALPVMSESVLNQLLFNAPATSEAWGIGRGGHKLSAGQIQFTFARTLLGKPETASQFKFCLEKIILKPLENDGRQLARSHSLRTWSSNRCSRAQHGLIWLHQP